MFNWKEKVRRTYVEWKEEFYLNLTSATAVQDEISRERPYIRRLQKKQPFFVENNNLMNIKIKI